MAALDRKWWTLIAVCTATFMLLLDITVVNVALPDIQQSLHASFSDLQWVVDAYSLTLAAFLLTAGVAGDIYGRRKIFAVGLVVFSLASLVCGLSTTPLMLNLARAVQGVGGAIMFATSLALIAAAFTGRDRGTAFGIYGAVIGGAVAIGPLIGGAITSGIGWRWIFFVNVPIGAIAVLITFTQIAKSEDLRSRRIDWVGFVTFSVSLFLLVFALVRGNDTGWGSTQIVAMLAASVILICTVGILSQHRGKVTTATGYGATRKITLPDGSTVALNAHSNLSYSKDWTTEKGREVWIEGEAFFTVARMAAGNSAKFTVHTKGLDIMVLGTAFNVYSRRDKVDVVLENGKVLAKGTGNAAQAGAVSMHPGQMIHLDSSRIRTTEVNTATYTSWKDDRLVFDNKTLADIAHILEDNYGYEVIWKNENAKHYPFTGSCPASNIKLLLSAISEVNDVKITQKDNQLIFE